MTETVRVNFSRSIPLFPLAETVLLPHAVLPLHIFEPRYRQMISACLDRSGQLAIGTVQRGSTPGIDTGDDPRPDIGDEIGHDIGDDIGHDISHGKGQTLEPTRVRTAACIGQIIQHDALPDGRYNILLHGVCRARIKQLIEPDGDRAFRMAKLAPIEPLEGTPAPMPEVRRELRTLLTSPCLKRLRGIETLMEWIDRDDVPTHALVELIGFALVRDTELKYQLLAEPDPMERAALIKDELRHIDQMVHSADRQSYHSWPKGMSWN